MRIMWGLWSPIRSTRSLLTHRHHGRKAHDGGDADGAAAADHDTELDVEDDEENLECEPCRHEIAFGNYRSCPRRKEVARAHRTGIAPSPGCCHDVDHEAGASSATAHRRSGFLSGRTCRYASCQHSEEGAAQGDTGYDEHHEEEIREVRADVYFSDRAGARYLDVQRFTEGQVLWCHPGAACVRTIWLAKVEPCEKNHHDDVLAQTARIAASPSLPRVVRLQEL